MDLKPVGSRPRCLYCGKELCPNYDRDQPNYRATDEEKRQFRKDHPPRFRGTYGRYKDNRFCGLGCGHAWACRHAPQPL